MTDLKFSGLGLSAPIQRALAERQHIQPTPIQAQAIPHLMDGRDMLGIAQTGTGKTAAFALPILHHLSEAPLGGLDDEQAPGRGVGRGAKQRRGKNRGSHAPRRPRALVLAPTRELAIQIADEFRAYGKYLHLRLTLIFGGVSQRPQVDSLNRGADIVIATPGRLLDLMGQGRLDLGGIQYLVLDEADRMLDMGFVRDVRKIVAQVPAERQSLLFSATMPADVARLSAEILTEPVRVEVTPQATPVERIGQEVHHVDTKGKTGLLTRVLEDPALSRVIVFARTKRRADVITRKLDQARVAAEAIHGNKAQNARQRALKRFRAGEIRVLVATDIAARGIDVEGVSHVINYDLPNIPESYVHRIGRTARAGAAGKAISFCDAEEYAYLRDIEKLTGINLTVIGDAPVAPPRETRARGRGKPKGRPKQARSRRGRSGGTGPVPGANGTAPRANQASKEDRRDAAASGASSAKPPRRGKRRPGVGGHRRRQENTGDAGRNRAA